MRLVMIESPFSGDVGRNKLYLKVCLLDCIKRGEAPYASHGLYTEVLDDCDREERRIGIEAGFAWGAKADCVVVYTDLGISPGMQESIDRATRMGQQIEYRRLKHV
jgi:hypothetical protein